MGKLNFPHAEHKTTTKISMVTVLENSLLVAKEEINKDISSHHESLFSELESLELLVAESEELLQPSR